VDSECLFPSGGTHTLSGFKWGAAQPSYFLVLAVRGQKICGAAEGLGYVLRYKDGGWRKRELS